MLANSMRLGRMPRAELVKDSSRDIQHGKLEDLLVNVDADILGIDVGVIGPSWRTRSRIWA